MHGGSKHETDESVQYTYVVGNNYIKLLHCETIKVQYSQKENHKNKNKKLKHVTKNKVPQNIKHHKAQSTNKH